MCIYLCVHVRVCVSEREIERKDNRMESNSEDERETASLPSLLGARPQGAVTTASHPVPSPATVFPGKTQEKNEHVTRLGLLRVVLICFSRMIDRNSHSPAAPDSA